MLWKKKKERMQVLQSKWEMKEMSPDVSALLSNNNSF